jgi:hypothetical protein
LTLTIESDKVNLISPAEKEEKGLMLHAGIEQEK